MAGKLCVSLTNAKNDTDKATVAFVIANAAVGSEQETLVFLSTEGVRLAVEGLPRERLALHVCRGNWTPDESVALAGDYRPLVPLLSRINVGTLLLELCTPRAGDEAVLRALPEDRRIGVGVVNQKRSTVESLDEVVAKAERAISLFGSDRVLLNPDCGFATFADNPIASAVLAEQKLAVIAKAATILRERYHVGG